MDFDLWIIHCGIVSVHVWFLRLPRLFWYLVFFFSDTKCMLNTLIEMHLWYGSFSFNLKVFFPFFIFFFHLFLSQYFYIINFLRVLLSITLRLISLYFCHGLLIDLLAFLLKNREENCSVFLRRPLEGSTHRSNLTPLLQTLLWWGKFFQGIVLMLAYIEWISRKLFC